MCFWVSLVLHCNFLCPNPDPTRTRISKHHPRESESQLPLEVTFTASMQAHFSRPFQRHAGFTRMERREPHNLQHNLPFPIIPGYDTAHAYTRSTFDFSTLADLKSLHPDIQAYLTTIHPSEVVVRGSVAALIVSLALSSQLRPNQISKSGFRQWSVQVFDPWQRILGCAELQRLNPICVSPILYLNWFIEDRDPEEGCPVWAKDGLPPHSLCKMTRRLALKRIRKLLKVRKIALLGTPTNVQAWLEDRRLLYVSVVPFFRLRSLP